jgi:hypothetical protein
MERDESKTKWQMFLALTNLADWPIGALTLAPFRVQQEHGAICHLGLPYTVFLHGRWPATVETLAFEYQDGSFWEIHREVHSDRWEIGFPLSQTEYELWDSLPLGDWRSE